MNAKHPQSLTTAEFFYFFLRLRKGEARRTVQALKNRYPRESPEQLAARLIEATSRLALIGRTILDLPLLFPGTGQALNFVGIVGVASMLARMHVYLILEIALVYEHDIDDDAWVPETIAVIAATALGSIAPPLLVHTLALNPIYAIPASAVAASANAPV